MKKKIGYFLVAKNKKVPVILHVPKKILNYINKTKILKEIISFSFWDPYVAENLLDRNYKPIAVKWIKIVINGFFKSQKNRIFISSSNISKKKPFIKSSITPTSKKIRGGVSVYYLMYIGR